MFDLATHLPPDQFEVAVITGGKGPLVEKLAGAGIRTIALPLLQKGNGFWLVLFSFRNLQAFFILISIFRREKPDIVHLNSSKIGGIGAVAARLSRISFRHHIKIIFTAHGWPFLEPRPHWQKAIIFFLTWIGTILQDSVITINSKDFKIGKKFIPRKKLHLIFNGLAAFDFLSKEEAHNFLFKFTKEKVSDNSVIIGAIAEYTSNKGLAYLIEAVGEVRRRFPQVKWMTFIIGEEGKERKNLEQKIKDLKLEEFVKLTGFVPEARQYLKGFDLLVLPSLKEGLPYVVMEAMAARVQIIATRVGGLPDLITDGQEGYLVSTRNTTALADAIMQAINNRTQSEAMIQKAAHKIQEKFSIKNMLENTINIYE